MGYIAGGPRIGAWASHAADIPGEFMVYIAGGPRMEAGPRA